MRGHASGTCYFKLDGGVGMSEKGCCCCNYVLYFIFPVLSLCISAWGSGGKERLREIGEG